MRIIVGFPAGVAADTIARLIAQSLSESLRQQFVVENRPGAGSNIATDAVVRATPDGYSLLLLTQTNAINATTYENLGFDFIRDIAPVAGICIPLFVMVISPLVPAKSAIRKVCARLVELCREMGLLTKASVAIDGSKFQISRQKSKQATIADRCGVRLVTEVASEFITWR